MQINCERGSNPMSNTIDEMMIQPTTKRVKLGESENEDRLSNLPESIILHILSFLNTVYAVRTCILSTKWKDFWKHLPALIMRSYEFRSLKIFNKFVSRVLSLRDSSDALESLDFFHGGYIDHRLLKRIVNYVSSHNVQRLGLEVQRDIEQIRHVIFSCQTLSFLKLSVYPGANDEEKTLFPNSISLPALTTLHLENFAFCASDNNACVEPFSTFNRLNTLVLVQCGVSGTLTLCISSATLVNFIVHSNSYYEFYKIEFYTPSLVTFSFTGKPYLKLSGSSLAYVKHVDIDAELAFPQTLLSWLLQLSYAKSLTVTAATLQVLSFINANLLKMKLSSLGNLKFLKVIKKPLSYEFQRLLVEVKLQKIKSRKEAANLRRSFEAGLEPFELIPNGIVEFLIQNSPSAEVDIVDC